MLAKAIKFLTPAIGENESRKNLMFLNIEVSTGDRKKTVLTAADAFKIKRVISYEDNCLSDGNYKVAGDIMKGQPKHGDMRKSVVKITVDNSSNSNGQGCESPIRFDFLRTWEQDYSFSAVLMPVRIQW